MQAEIICHAYNFSSNLTHFSWELKVLILYETDRWSPCMNRRTLHSHRVTRLDVSRECKTRSTYVWFYCTLNLQVPWCFVCNSYIISVRDILWHLLHQARGHEAAWGLSALYKHHASQMHAILYPMCTATMDTHRTLEKEGRDMAILLETVVQSHSRSQLSNVSRTLDGMVTEGCGQIDTKID